jgi:excisionase family DNA binding protein
MTAETMLRPSQAAARLGISYSRLAELLREGVLPFETTPYGRLIPETAVDNEIARRAAK